MDQTLCGNIDFCVGDLVIKSYQLHSDLLHVTNLHLTLNIFLAVLDAGLNSF